MITSETRILAAAKARDIHTSTLELFERILGPVRTSLAWKKARLIHCEPASRDLQPNPYPTVWPLEQTPYRIHNHANVYSRASLDIGARFFLAHLPAGVGGQIADLGCGNGVIGLSALALNPEARLLFIDESYMAVDASRLNVQHNRPEDLARCEFRVNHSLDGIADGSLDLVLCNPPFHQQQAITDHLAWQMFLAAYRCRKPGGELRIIGNRHLGYHIRITSYNVCYTKLLRFKDVAGSEGNTGKGHEAHRHQAGGDEGRITSYNVCYTKLLRRKMPTT